MSDSEKTAVAAHLYVTLRRTANRVIDVEWLAKNEEYAREIIKLARQQGSEDLTHYADRYEIMLFGKSSVPVAEPKPVVQPKPAENMSRPAPEEDGGEDSSPHYIGHLR